MKSRWIFFAVLLSSCAYGPVVGVTPASAGYSPTAADNQEMNAYVNAMPARAAQLENTGDQIAVSDPATAIKDYAFALGLTVITGRYHMQFFGGADPVAQGWQLTTGIDAGPAYDAGMRNGDIITAVNGVSVAGLSRVGASNLINDDPFDPPTLTVIRAGAAPFDVKLTMPELERTSDLLTVSDWAMADRLLEKQVALYAKMATLPPVPSEARRLAAKGQTLAKTASTTADFKAASYQFKLASFAAPWWADLYVNYGLFQDASNDALGAKQSFENYALLNPQGHDLDAVKAKIAGLSGRAADQAKLVDWEGWWSQFLNGQKQTTGMTIARDGNLLSVTNTGKSKPWLRATITDDNTAQAIIRFSDDSSILQPAFLNAVNKCFNGAMEVSTTMTLSPDRQQLTLVSYNDIDVDFGSCAIVRQDKSTMVWVK